MSLDSLGDDARISYGGEKEEKGLGVKKKKNKIK